MVERFPEPFLDELRAAVPITDVVGHHVVWDKSKSSPGRDDLWAACPFHNESSPSFHAEGQEGRYHCFGCGASGDHFQFLMALNGVDFPSAVAEIAGMAGISMPEGTGTGKPARPPEHPRQTKAQPQPLAAEGKREMVATYDYPDRDGNLIYQVCRFQIRMPDGTFALNKDGKGTWKTFLQRRPSGLGDGSWVWGLSAGDFMRPAPGKDWSAYAHDKFQGWTTGETRRFPEGVEHTIFNHPAVEIAIAEGRPIILAEGEKDARTADKLGFCGTTNSSGSKHWTDAHAANFRDADVVICLDNDAAGDRADKLAKSLKGTARRIRVLNFADHVTGFDHKGDITDWVEKFGGTADQLVQILHRLPDYRPKPPPSTFGADTSKNVAGSEIVYDWLIKGLIERHGVFIIAGESQAGKSFFVKDLGMKVARGLEYGGRKTRKGVVIHVAVEDGRGTKLRQKGYRKHHGISPDADVPYIIMDPSAGQGFTLMNDESVDRLIAEVKAWAEYYGMPVELIIIDTLSVATEGLDEINGAEAGKVLARVNRLRDATGAAIGLVHHMNAQGTRVRGHSSIVANVPNVIEIRPMMTIPANKNGRAEPILDGQGRHKRRAVLTKNKNGLNDIKWTFVLEVVHLGHDEDGDEITTCVCGRAVDNRREEEDERHKLSPDQKLVYDALQAAQDADGQDMPHGTTAGPQIKRCAPLTTFEAMVRKTMTFTAKEEEVEARNRELATFIKRTTTALINAGYMGRDNDRRIAWWTGKSDRPRPIRRDADPPQQPDTIPEEIRQDLANDPVPF